MIRDSATAGFYINLVDNMPLDADPRRGQPGYAVFGAVIDGLDVVDRIGRVPTGPDGPFRQDAPAEPVVIKAAHRLR